MMLQDQYILSLAKDGKRIDGRQHDEYRKISVKQGVIPKAEGSAEVRMGDTWVMAGVKFGIGTPYTDKPDEGTLMTGAEFTPLASPEFERGPPGEDAIELARVVDRGIRESGTLDFKKLCIEKGEKVWMIFLDIHIINHAGNLIDACALAAMAAILDAKMPKLKDGEIVYGEKTKTPLAAKFKPITVSAVRIGENLLLDPNLEEESAMSARLTVSTKDNGNICAVQKSVGDGFTPQEIESVIELSVKKGKELRKLLG